MSMFKYNYEKKIIERFVNFMNSKSTDFGTSFYLIILFFVEKNKGIHKWTLTLDKRGLVSFGFFDTCDEKLVNKIAYDK